MSAVLPLAMFALAGVLVGGAWSTFRHGGARGTVALLSFLAAFALAGGILWLWPGGE